MTNLETVLIIFSCLVVLIAWIFGIKLAYMDIQIEKLKNELKNKADKEE